MLADLATGFVTLLLLPLLGVIGLLQKRAIPLLAWTLGLWAAFGTWALLSEHTFAWSRERFLRGWLLGLGLGAAFLLGGGVSFAAPVAEARTMGTPADAFVEVTTVASSSEGRVPTALSVQAGVRIRFRAWGAPAAP